MGQQPASSDHFWRSSFLRSIVGYNGCRVYSSTPTSRTVFFGSGSTDCARRSCCPMVRLAAAATGWWSCTSGMSKLHRPAKGPSLAWGRQLDRCFAESLRELARFLMTKPELGNITIIRANMSLGSKAQSASLYGIVSRHGFEVFPDEVGLSLSVHARRFGENILYWLLTLVSNPAASRSNKFWRTRSWICLSRSVLERKYITADERAVHSGQTRTGTASIAGTESDARPRRRGDRERRQEGGIAK